MLNSKFEFFIIVVVPKAPDINIVDKGLTIVQDKVVKDY